MDDWHRHMPQVMGAYNSTKHFNTGISPHKMLTGHEKALPLTFFYPEYEGKKTAPKTYVRDVIRRQQDLNDLCRRNTQQAQIRQKRRFDKKDCRRKSLIGWRLCLGVPGSCSTKKNRSAPRRSFLSIEHRTSSSLRKHQTAQCLIRGLVRSS